jgi:DNA-binding transcriptional ArsR family regulator
VESKVDTTLAALSDPSRRAVVELLRKSPLCSSEIASRLSMSRPAMSRHLRVLRRSGLVEENDDENDARIRLYRLRPERFAELRGWVEEVEAFWGEQLAGFKAHAERRQRRRAP